MRLKPVFTAMLCGLLAYGFTASAAPQGLQLNLQPTGLIQLNVSMERGKFGASYAIGEAAQVWYRVTTSQPVSCAFVYLFDITANGSVRLIFPNAFSASNCVLPNVQHVLPDRASYELAVVPPAGQEVIQGLASFVPLNLGPLGNGQFPLLGQTLEQARQRLLSAIAQLNNSPLATDLTSFFVTEVPSFPTNQPPVACFNASASVVAPGQAVWFDSSCSFDPDFGDFIAGYQWDLNNDGLFESSGPTAGWTFFTPGPHGVQLRVTDSRGLSNTTFRTVLVSGAPAPTPPRGTANFTVELVDPHTVMLSIQGDPTWFLARSFQALVETDGFFNVATPQAGGNASYRPPMIMPAPFSGQRADLRGQVGSGGRVDYLISFSTTSTRLKFDLRLDVDGDGFPEQVPLARILVGTLGTSPPSNPFSIRVG